jgi:glycosyltransferase involved in cell wall biosynthesis
MISYIIPVYNAENTIVKLLKSICESDSEYQNFEVICVNDGSTDRSAELIMQYAIKHPEVRLFNQKNMGVANAKGDWLAFADSDDEYIKGYDP